MTKLLIVLLISVNGTFIHAASFYLSEDGSGNKSGSSASNAADGQNPDEWLRGIYGDTNGAGDDLQPGDTLFIERGGTYNIPGRFDKGFLDISISGEEGNPITIDSFGGLPGAPKPIIRGNRLDGQLGVGDYAIRIAEGANYWNVKNVDFQNWQNAVFTSKNEGNLYGGKIQGWQFSNISVSHVQSGFRIAGAAEDECGQGCEMPVIGTSSGWIFNDITVEKYAQDGFEFRNGTQNMILTNITVDGGGSYDDGGTTKYYSVGSGGQTGINIGRSSGGTIAGGDNNYTPDQGFEIANFTATNMQNNGWVAGSYQGDGLKTEALSSGTLIGGYITGSGDAGIDSKGNWEIENVVAHDNTINFKSYSGSRSSEAETKDNVTLFRNVLGHTATEQVDESTGASETAVSVKAFGKAEFENSTIFGLEDDGTALFSINQLNNNPVFDTFSITLTDTVYGFWEADVPINPNPNPNPEGVEGGGSGLSIVVGGQSQNFTDNGSGAYFFDNEGGPSIGIEPQFFDPDTNSVSGIGWDSAAHPQGIGWQPIKAPNADFNSSGLVDGNDFLKWQRGFGTLLDADLSDGDALEDGDVDKFDLGTWEQQFGSPLPITANLTTTIPEPSTWLLLAIGGALVTLRNRSTE